MQMDESVTDEEIQKQQEKLNQVYDTYTAKYGVIGSNANKRAFSDDSSYCLLCSLEDFLIPYGLYLLLCFLLKEFINSLYYKSIKSEVSISKKRFTTIKHFVYDTLIDLPNSKFVLMIDEETKIISPAVYTKRNGRVSMINRNADFDVYEQIEINNGSFSKDYTFIRSYKIRDKKTGEQVLFVAVPNRETDILAYSDSAHKADKTITFGKFRIFCFVETDNNLYTDLIVDSEKIHLEKSKRKGMYFIGLDEVTKEK